MNGEGIEGGSMILENAEPKPSEVMVSRHTAVSQSVSQSPVILVLFDHSILKRVVFRSVFFPRFI